MKIPALLRATILSTSFLPGLSHAVPVIAGGNGNFDATTTGNLTSFGSGLYGGGLSSLDGWTFSGGTNNTFRWLFDSTCPFGPVLGSYSLNLTQASASFANVATTTVTGLTAGQGYALSFDTAARSGGSGTVTVKVDGTTVGTFDQTVGTTYVARSFSFTASGTSASVSFEYGSTVNNNGYMLDNVAVIEEPWTPADGIWSGGSGDWNTAGNWQAGVIAQGIDKSATFSVITPLTATVNVSRPIGALNFSGADHTIAAGSGSLTLDGDTLFAPPTVTVAPGITATIGAQLAGNEGLAKAGAGTLVLSGSRIYTGTTDVTEGTLKLDLGASSGNAALGSFSVSSGATFGLDNTNTTTGSYFPQNFVLSGSGTLAKTGVGSIDFWNGSNLTGFTGTVDVQQGALRINNIATNGNMPQATLNIASGAIFDVRYNASLSVDELTGSGTLDQSFNGGSGLSVTVGSNDGSSTFGGVIQNSSGQPLSLTKVGTGTFTLTAASTYTGTTTVEAGTLSLAQAFLNNNAAVVIGFDGTLNLAFSGTDVVGSLRIEGTELPPGVYNSSHPVYGTHFTGTGSLEIPGVNGTWTSLVNGDWSVAANWSGSSVASGIDSIATFSAATGVTVNLDSNRPIGGLVFGTTGYTLAGASTLTLNTTSDISTLTVGTGLAATISAKLASVDQVTKAGAGTLTLSAQNNFSNAINVSEGTLELAIDWTLGNIGTGTAIVPGLVTVESGATLRAVNSLANQLNGLTLNGGTVDAVGVGNADWGNFHLTGNVTATGTSNLNGDIALRAGNVDFFTDTGATLNVGGVMHNGAFYGIYFGAPANVSKSGDGTMVLSASNTYTGSTTVSGGTLVLADNAQLKFAVTDTPAANMVTGTGTATLGGDFNIDTTGVSGTTGHIWLLVDKTNLNPASSFTSTFTVIGFSDPENDGIWTMTDAKGDWSFSEATGELTLDVGTDYDDWGASYGLATGSEGGDLDNDGLTNGQEYAFGLLPNSGASVNPITSPLSKATGEFAYQRRDNGLTGLTYTVWYSTDLTNWLPDMGALQPDGTPDPNGVEVINVTLSSGLLTNSKLFVQVRAE